MQNIALTSKGMSWFVLKSNSSDQALEAESTHCRTTGSNIEIILWIFFSNRKYKVINQGFFSNTLVEISGLQWGTVKQGNVRCRSQKL